MRVVLLHLYYRIAYVILLIHNYSARLENQTKISQEEFSKVKGAIIQAQAAAAPPNPAS